MGKKVPMSTNDTEDTKDPEDTHHTENKTINRNKSMFDTELEIRKPEVVVLLDSGLPLSEKDVIRVGNTEIRKLKRKPSIKAKVQSESRRKDASHIRDISSEIFQTSSPPPKLKRFDEVVFESPFRPKTDGLSKHEDRIDSDDQPSSLSIEHNNELNDANSR